VAVALRRPLGRGGDEHLARLAHAVPLGVRGDDVPGNGEQPRLERPCAS